MHSEFKAIGIIQARMSSKRLPGKMMRLLSERPMLWHVFARASRCETLSKVIVATSTDPSDDPIADYCRKNDMPCFRGSLNNVLKRFVDILHAHPCSHFVRITGDCPLIDPNFIDFQVEIAKREFADIIQLEKRSLILEGQGLHSTSSIFKVAANSRDIGDLEHVGAPYLLKNKAEFKTVGVALDDFFYNSNVRVTVDELSDFECMSSVYNSLWVPNSILSLVEAVNFITSDEKLAKLNQKAAHKRETENLNLSKHQNVSDVASWHRWDGPAAE